MVDTDQYDSDYLSQFSILDDDAGAGSGEGLFGRLLRGGKQSNGLSERMLQTCSDPTQKTRLNHLSVAVKEIMLLPRRRSSL